MGDWHASEEYIQLGPTHNISYPSPYPYRYGLCLNDKPTFS